MQSVTRWPWFGLEFPGQLVVGTALAASWILAGCGPTSPGGPDGSGDPDHPDEVPACEREVCFDWLAEQPPAPDTGGGGQVRVEYDECNWFGMRPGHCPDAFDCGPSETFVLPTFEVRTPVCSPSGWPPRVLNVDLDPEPIAPDAVEVSLELTLNDEPWPDGSVDLERAGTFRAVSRRDPQLAWTFDIPAREPILSMQLPPDTYEVTVAISDYEGRHYPGGMRTGVLQVTAAGSDVLPFEAAIANLQVRFDGVAVGALEASHTVQVQLTRVQGGSAGRSFGEGDTPAARMVLAPGDYRLGLTTYAYSDPMFPEGQQVLPGQTWLPARESTALPLDASTVLVTGSITVDGADLPPGSPSGDVIFARDGAASKASVSDTRPARFTRRLFTGTYDILYDARSAWGLAGIPNGVAPARSSWVASPSVAINVNTVEVSGDVVLNGAPLPAGSGARVVFGGEHGNTSFWLGSEAGGAYQGRMFQGTYVVAVEGDGDPLPDFDVPVAAQWTATSTPQSWRIDAHRLTISMTHNGETPPAAADRFERGYITIETELLGQEVATSLEIPQTGAIQVSAIVPDGGWKIGYWHWDDAYTGTPLGTSELGQTQVSGAPRTESYDLRSVWVSGEVMQAGLALPAVTDPADRGRLLLGAGMYGHGGGGWIPAFPTSGPAAYGLWVTPGVYDLSYSCSTDRCRALGLPTWVSVYSGLRIE